MDIVAVLSAMIINLQLPGSALPVVRITESKVLHDHSLSLSPIGSAAALTTAQTTGREDISLPSGHTTKSCRMHILGETFTLHQVRDLQSGCILLWSSLVSPIPIIGYGETKVKGSDENSGHYFRNKCLL
jgi:hypothetical protein